VFPAPREVTIGQTKLSRAVVVRGVLSLRSHVEGRSTGTRLLEKSMDNSDDEDFRGLMQVPT